MAVGNSDWSGPNNGAGGANNRFTNGYTWRGRNDIFIDTRTATEYGVVRSYGEMTLSWTDDNYAGNGSGATVYAPLGPAPFGAAPGNATPGGVAGGSLGVYYAYIQFAGFTMGKAISEFSAPWQNYPGNNFDSLVGGGGAVTGVNQFTYTAQFGNGISADISIQDQVAYSPAGVVNLGLPLSLNIAPNPVGGAFGISDYAGTMAPDIVGGFTVDQAWGLFQFSAAAHDNHVAYYSGFETSGHPSDKWGWAVQAALQIKNIPTGAGDTINVQGVYTSAATRYNIQDLSQMGSVTMYNGTSNPFAYQKITVGFAPDTVFANNGQGQQAINTWGMRGAFNHNWDPYWSSALYGAWAQISYSGGAKALACNTSGIGVQGAVERGDAIIFNCNPDYQVAQVGFIHRWTPVKNLTFSGDVVWTYVDQKYQGFLTTSSTSIGKPPAVYVLGNAGNVTALFRAQRNF